MGKVLLLDGSRSLRMIFSVGDSYNHSMSCCLTITVIGLSIHQQHCIAPALRPSGSGCSQRRNAGGFFAAGPPQGKNAPLGDEPGHKTVPADCFAPGESERRTSREVDSKPKARRGGLFYSNGRLQHGREHRLLGPYIQGTALACPLANIQIQRRAHQNIFGRLVAVNAGGA